MKKKKLILMLPITLFLFSIIAVFLLEWENEKNIRETPPAMAVSADDIKSSKDKVTSYVGETIYKGKTDIPELYEYPFQKTDAYVMNKTYAKEHPETVKELPGFVAEYFQCLLGSDYRYIINNTTEWDNQLASYYNPSTIYSDSLDSNIRDSFTAKDYIEDLSEHLVNNRMSMDAEFISDDSLVYSDGYIYVRGLLHFTIQSCDGEPPYPIGEDQEIILDVAVKPSDEFNEANERSYQIVSFEEVRQ